MNLTPFTHEDVAASMFDPRALRVSPQPLARFHKGGNRFYYVKPQPGEAVNRAFPSATTITKSQMPMGAGLLKWIGSLGYEEAQAQKNDRAEYGTCMHMLIERYLIGYLSNEIENDERKITGQPLRNFVFYQEDLVREIEMFAYANGLADGWITTNVYELARDLAAFHRFFLDHNVKPIVIETPLINRMMGYACTVDLVADIDLKVKGFHGEVYKTGKNKGQPKETYEVKTIRCCINFKSGRKGSYDSTAVQLHLEQMAVEENFPELGPIEKCFRWSPKDWKGQTPTYTLEDLTEKEARKKTSRYVELANIEFEHILTQPYKTSLLRLAFGDTEESSDVQIEELSIQQYLMQHHSDVPPVAEEAPMVQPEGKEDQHG